KLVEEKGRIPAQLQSDLDRLGEAGIPVDVVFEQGTEVLGLEAAGAIPAAAGKAPVGGRRTVVWLKCCSSRYRRSQQVKPDQVKPYKKVATGKKEQVAQMFNQIAGKYDFLNHFLSAGIDRSWRRKAIDELKEVKPTRILDVATG